MGSRSLFLHGAGGGVHDPPLEDEEQDCDRNRHQHRRGKLQRVAVAGSELPGRKLRNALRQRVQAGALCGDDEMPELVPGALEREDEERSAVDDLWPYALGVLPAEEREALSARVGRNEVQPGERGTHPAELAELWDEMTVVRRSAPAGAQW